ncbi:protein VASCULAR ASSOCIATED DEATH 1, chloroplastic isoform X2 [Syzygium oleosum]|uniref:protein VASCULAR ASSOCIATED DEATH 1, chloroplastic isoform X2 n=1 Tax=Syzygium oleosum TaxID=219896 RepID=UPI0024B889FC|nr:protein VASCULAR ASSOCIATED DEATH 1, chloroplastic isoform X2 [Syzygium oleosum]
MAVASSPSSAAAIVESMDAAAPPPRMSPPEAAAAAGGGPSPPSPAASSGATESPDRCDPSPSSSPAAQRDAEIQVPSARSPAAAGPPRACELRPSPLTAASLRSEEYRQLFRLPPEEVLVQDFNCACQENILIQGHMYLFVHYICFYSNIFGFETKKIIHFGDITSVKRAKTAGIFPNAIEILAGGKKYFFASFLSRDEAFKLINDGWMQLGGDSRVVIEKQASTSELSFQENGSESDLVRSSKCLDDMEISNGNVDVPIPVDTVITPNAEDDNASATVSEFQDTEEHESVPTPVCNSSSSEKTWSWKVEDYDAPKIPDYQTKVAESKFPLKVEDFFNLFFSNDAVEFIESFHKRCGDKELKCSPWQPHDQFGHAREVSFQHPIKIYFGARFGSCQEQQKFRVYRNSHLVIETSQEINDVPYGDYFRVEALWDVRRDGDESKQCCSLCVYVNVAFLKKTMFRGKIVQSTLEECREAYAIWVDMAHELLKERNLEKQEDRAPECNLIQNGEANLQSKENIGNATEVSTDIINSSRTPKISDSTNVQQHEASFFHVNRIDSASTFSVLRETVVKFLSNMRSPTNFPLLVAVIFAVILLMQVSIVLLLSRPQNIHVISQADYLGGLGSGAGERSPEAVAWLEKRLYHLKDEMTMVETRLERMRLEHARLKEQLRELEHVNNQRRRKGT